MKMAHHLRRRITPITPMHVLKGVFLAYVEDYEQVHPDDEDTLLDCLAGCFDKLPKQARESLGLSTRARFADAVQLLKGSFDETAAVTGRSIKSSELRFAPAEEVAKLVETGEAAYFPLEHDDIRGDFPLQAGKQAGRQSVARMFEMTSDPHKVVGRFTADFGEIDLDDAGGPLAPLVRERRQEVVERIEAALEEEEAG